MPHLKFSPKAPKLVEPTLQTRYSIYKKYYTIDTR